MWSFSVLIIYTIKDAGLVPLGGEGIGNGDFTTGEVYSIDTIAPTIAIGDPSPATFPRSTWAQFASTTRMRIRMV